MELNPSEDGVTHINIYSKGKTRLGVFLSNFTRHNVTTEDGQFASIEGYWYWLSNRQEAMRALYGYKAKQVGKSYPRVFTLSEEEFRKKIANACWHKIHTSTLFQEFVTSTLPFTHYYTFSNGFSKDAGFSWLVDMWEYFRTYIRNGYK